MKFEQPPTPLQPQKTIKEMIEEAEKNGQKPLTLEEYTELQRTKPQQDVPTVEWTRESGMNPNGGTPTFEVGVRPARLIDDEAKEK